MVVFVALFMVMSLTSRVDADTITISVDSSGTPDENTNAEVYSAYKIFDVVKAASVTDPVTTDDSVAAQPADPLPTGFNYTIAKNSVWYDTVSTKLTNYITLTEIASDQDNMTVSLKDGVAANEATAKAIAAILEENIPEEGANPIQVTLGSPATADPGYYLIVSTIGSNLILGTTNIVIVQKNTYPTLEKLEKDEDATDYGTTAEVAVGDVIDYQVTVNVPAAAKADIVLTDTMFEGLTYDQTTGLTVKVGETALTEDTDYKVGTATANSWILTIKATDATKGKDVVVTFKATVNEKSIGVADTAKKNSVQLDFSNFRQTDDVPYTTKASAIFKYDGATTATDANVKKLEGVKFTLKEGTAEFPVTKHTEGYYYYDAENGSSEVVTDKDGLIVIRGLDGDKTYTLTETETLAGYNLLDGPLTLALAADTNEYEASPTSATPVPNNQGTVLPSTGGIGTTIFYALGSALVIGAGVILVAKKRVNG